MRFGKVFIALPYLAIFVAHLIWGANFVVAKLALNEFPVMTLSFLRFFFAVIFIVPFLFKLNLDHLKIKLVDLPKIFLAGLLLTTINISLFYEGLQRTEAINSSVLHLLIPMMSLLAGWWFLKEKVFWINLMGIFMGLLGALAIIGLPVILTGSLVNGHLAGNVITILSCVSYVVGAVFLKELLQKYQPLVITILLFAIGAATFVFPAYLDYANNPSWVSQISILGFMSLLYIALLSTVAGFFLLTWGLKRVSITHANLMQYVEPAIVASLAVPFLGERISYSFIVGTCLIILGVYWGTLGKINHHHLIHRHHKS